MKEQKAIFTEGEDLPVLDQVVDPASDRGRLISALDELADLIEHVPRPVKFDAEARLALEQELVRRLCDRLDAMTAQLKRDIPALVERSLKAHLDKKNER